MEIRVLNIINDDGFWHQMSLRFDCTLNKILHLHLGITSVYLCSTSESIHKNGKKIDFSVDYVATGLVKIPF